jgi:hypothetical protein
VLVSILGRPVAYVRPFSLIFSELIPQRHCWPCFRVSIVYRDDGPQRKYFFAVANIPHFRGLIVNYTTCRSVLRQLMFFSTRFSALGWCILSTCLGRPLLAFFKSLWESSVNSAHISGSRTARRRRELGENEIWEMEYRGRAG